MATPAGKPAQIAGPQDLLASVGHENDLALDNPDELVLMRVPVALARPGIRRKVQEVDPELGHAGRVTESAASAGATRLIIGRRVAGGSLAARDRAHVDL